MHVTLDSLAMMQHAYRTQSELQLLERGHQGPDHPIHIAIPETDYLKSLSSEINLAH
jgi:23S rRNA (cytosine1962-C5)-methyltransferase